MLNKIYDICTENNRLNGVLVAPTIISVLTLCVSCAIGVASTEGGDPVIESWQIFFLTILSWIVPALLLLIDTLINKFVMFVQDNEKSCPNFFYRKLFSEQFEVIVGRNGAVYSADSDTTQNAYIVLASVLFTAWFIPYMSMLVPFLGYLFLVLATIIGVVVGFLLICRKVVRLSKRLNRHVNDPDAHTRLKE